MLVRNIKKFYCTLHHLNYCIPSSQIRSSYGDKKFYLKYLNDQGKNNGVQQTCNENFFGIDSENGVIIVSTHKNSEVCNELTLTNTEKFHELPYGVIRCDSDNVPIVHGQCNSKRNSKFQNGTVDTSYAFENFHQVKPEEVVLSANLFYSSKTVSNHNHRLLAKQSNIQRNVTQDHDKSYRNFKVNTNNLLENEEKHLNDKHNSIDQNSYKSYEKFNVYHSKNMGKTTSFNNKINHQETDVNLKMNFINTNLKNVHENNSNEVCATLEQNKKIDFIDKEHFGVDNKKYDHRPKYDQTNPRKLNYDDTDEPTNNLNTFIQPVVDITSNNMKDGNFNQLHIHDRKVKDSHTYNLNPLIKLEMKEKKCEDHENLLYDAEKSFLFTQRKGHTQNAELLDSKGFRILKNQVPDFSQITKDEIISILQKNILYLDDDLLILNKVYNLVIHDSQTTLYPCLSQLLDEFAQVIDPKTPEPKLHFVHRLDKQTTGCLLLARNEMAAQRLKSLFAHREILKRYWIVTSGVPNPLKGIIDIPIAEGYVHDKKRMVLHPHLPKEVDYKSHSKNGKPAVTSYQVMSISGSAALIDVYPTTGVKHQIRVHFGFGLMCPILGDHKYSHLNKMVPQKLPSDMLQRLHVRQAKVRHIPLHLHAYGVTIPKYLNGRDLSVTAPLPYHMVANLKKLKFKKKNKLVL